MRNIHNALKGQIEYGNNINLYIAQQILLMKRLWKGSELKPVRKMREIEAQII